MRIIEYPLRVNLAPSVHVPPVLFPDKLMEEMRSRFPLWGDLHQAMSEGDSQGFWALLHRYSSDMRTFTPEDLMEADQEGQLPDLVERARQGIELRDLPSLIGSRFPVLNGNGVSSA